MSAEAQRWILHVDLDCFFVSVERLLDPSLVGLPVAVGGTPEGRGVVASASYEARRFGVRSAMPMGRALALCPQLKIVPGRHGVYGEYSQRAHAIFEQFSPLVQMASLDEAYLDLTGTERLHGHPLKAATALRERLQRGLGLPSSFGLASNKLVSKVASDLAKPSGGLWVPHGGEARLFAHMELRRLPGIGPKSAEHLGGIGLKVAADVVALGRDQLAAILGERAGKELFAHALGQSDSPVVPERDAVSISHERTLTHDTADPDVLLPLLSLLCEKVGSRLRDHNRRARSLTLKLRFSDFHTITRAAQFPSPTNGDAAIFAAARELLERAWTNRRPVRLIGVAAGALTDDEWQPDLLESGKEERLSRLYEGIDRLRSRHGFRAVLRGGSLRVDNQTYLTGGSGSKYKEQRKKRE